MKKNVYAYFDGSNFYNRSKDNYGITRIDFNLLVNELIRGGEELKRIKYFIAPVNRQEEPGLYRGQQKFFAKLNENKNIKLVLGKLVSRPINRTFRAL